MLAVVLSHQIVDHVPGAAPAAAWRPPARSPTPPARRLADPLAQAFGGAFWWAVALTAIAIIPAIVLALVEP